MQDIWPHFIALYFVCLVQCVQIEFLKRRGDLFRRRIDELENRIGGDL